MNDTKDKDSRQKTGKPTPLSANPWRTTLGAVVGMLVGIMVVGIVGLSLNQNITRAADRALRYDVELEDNGDDLRVAVLEVRQHQRTLYFSDSGPTRSGIQTFESSYDYLLEEIGEYEELDVSEENLTQPDEFREAARTYYEDYRSAIDDFQETGDVAAWDSANDIGLARIDTMQEDAADIDDVGEELSEQSLQRVNNVARTGSLVLLVVIAGLLAAGGLLAYSTIRVVTELRRLNEEQDIFAKKLAEASRAKTDFLADVSHELRTPLTVLRGNAEIGMQLGADDTQKEILGEILGESNKMTKMVEDLLLLARSDSSSLPLSLEATDIERFLKELSGRAMLLAGGKDASLECDLRAKGTVEMDRGRFEQVVMILIDNAAKYAGKEGPVHLSSFNSSDPSDGSDHIVIQVKDEGSGIPKGDLDRIFERFYRVDKTRARKLGGTGLGLPIAKTIVESHEGNISADSEFGKGTTMTIHLPVKKPSDMAESPNDLRISPAHS